MREIVDNNQEELQNNINVTNELLVDEIMLLMGYNKKRIRGIHRIYSDDIDWKVTIGDNKRFVIDTVAYGMEITEDDINTAAQYCAENEFPFGFITNGDDIVIVSGCKDDEQPILRSQVFETPEDAAKILEMYDYKSYDSTKIKDYYMQFQFTMDKLKERLSHEDARQAMYDTAENFAECKPSERNKNIIKKFMDTALDGKQTDAELEFEASEEEKRLTAEKAELEAQIEDLNKQLVDAKSKIDTDATTRSELQVELDEKIKELDKVQQTLEVKQDELNTLQKNIDAMQETVNGKQDEIDKLKETAQAEQESLQAEKQEALEKVQNLEEKVEELAKQLEAAEKQKEEQEKQQEEQTVNSEEPTSDSDEQTGASEEPENIEVYADEAKLKLLEIESKHEQEVNALNQQIADLKAALADTKTDLAAARAMLDKKEMIINNSDEDNKSESLVGDNGNLHMTGLADGHQVNVEAHALMVDSSKDVEELNQELATKQAALDTLQQQFDESKNVIIELTNDKVTLQAQVDALTDKVEQLQKNAGQTEQVDSSEEQNTESTEKADNADSDEIKTLNEKLVERDRQIEDLTQQLAVAQEKLGMVQMELAAIKESHTIKTDEVKLEVGGDSEKVIQDLIQENQQLKTQIRIMTDSGNLTAQADNFAMEVEKYRSQINELHVKIQALEVEINQKGIKIEELEDKLVRKGSKKQVEAMDLLDSIEDDPQQERTYVAVIDDNLFQERNIKRFIGICIEELYKTAAVSLMPMLYDSNNFHIREVRNGENCDFTLGVKRYALDISDDTEDSLMQKAVSMYKEYPDRVFYCKKIGSVKVQFDDMYHSDKAVNSDDAMSLESDHTTDENSNIETSENNGVENVETVDNNQVAENNDNGDNVDATGMVDGYAYFGIRGTEQLLTYQYAQCISIAAIYTATNNRYYTVDDQSLASQVISQVQALIAACSSNMLEAGLKNYKALGTLNGLLEPMTMSNKGLPKMPMTKTAISNVNSMEDVDKILVAVADAFGYDEQLVQIMYKIKYVEGDENIQGCLGSIDDIIEDNVIDYPGDSVGNFFEKRIDGGITDNTILSRNSLEIQSKIFRGLTKVINEDINNEIVQDDQFADVVQQMFRHGLANRRKIDPRMFGQVVGTDRMAVSTNKADVLDKYVTVRAGNQVYYVSRPEPVLLIYELIRMQTALYGNKQITFCVNISEDAFKFYRDEFRTNQPQLDMLVKTIVNYVETRM